MRIIPAKFQPSSFKTVKGAKGDRHPLSHTRYQAQTVMKNMTPLCSIGRDKGGLCVLSMIVYEKPDLIKLMTN